MGYNLEIEKNSWAEEVWGYAINSDYWEDRARKAEEALKRIQHELSVPGEGYPANVANAYAIAEEIIGDKTVKGAD